MTLRHRQAGLSIVELMVSITLGLMILSGVLVVFVNTSAARNEVEKTARQIENGRYASEVLTEDLRLAGFYGELNVGDLAAPALPADPCSISPADWRGWMPIHLQGYDETAFVSAVAGCAFTNLKPNTDVLVVRRARACVAGIDGCDGPAAGKPYVQVSLCATQLAPNNFRLGLQGTQAFDMQKKDCDAAKPANQREYYVRIYFIATDNGAGQDIPTLKRLELSCNALGNCEWQTVPLVEGIEELQFHYGLDTDNDGAPNLYVANPNDYPVGACAAPCPRDNWMRVVTVQFHVLARNLEPSTNYTDAKTYVLGVNAAGNPIQRTPGDTFRRHVYSGLVRVANPAARREKP